MTETLDFTGDRLPKLCGADIELGNFVLGVERRLGTGEIASRALLREIVGFPRGGRVASGCNCEACRSGRNRDTDRENSWYRAPAYRGPSGSAYGSRWPGTYSSSTSDYSYNSQDWGRKYLADNGGCAYIDLDHLELCIPE